MNTRCVFSMIVLVSCAGCATVKKGFVGDEHEDIGPFAEATIELIGGTAIEFRKSELVYLRRYYDESSEASGRLARRLLEVDQFRDDIVDYSIDLVRISDSFPTDAEKCQELAATIEEPSGGVIYSTNISDSEYAALAQALRGEQNFLACLRLVQPLVARNAEELDAMILDIEETVLPELRGVLDANIEKEFAPVMRQLEIIYDRRDNLFRGLQAIFDYRNGDASTLRRFNATNTITNQTYKLSNSPSDPELDRTKDYIIKQLQKEQEIYDLLAGDRADYIATHAELDREEQEILAGLELARRQVVAWVRAHQGLANGVRDPGRWLKGLLQAVDGYKRVRG